MSAYIIYLKQLITFEGQTKNNFWFKVSVIERNLRHLLFEGKIRKLGKDSSYLTSNLRIFDKLFERSVQNLEVAHYIWSEFSFKVIATQGSFYGLARKPL